MADSRALKMETREAIAFKIKKQKPLICLYDCLEFRSPSYTDYQGTNKTYDFISSLYLSS